MVASRWNPTVGVGFLNFFFSLLLISFRDSPNSISDEILTAPFESDSFNPSSFSLLPLSLFLSSPSSLSSLSSSLGGILFEFCFFSISVWFSWSSPSFRFRMLCEEKLLRKRVARWKSCSVLVLFSFEFVLFWFEVAGCCEEEISKLRLARFDSFYSPLTDCEIGGAGGVCDFVLLLYFEALEHGCCCELHSVSILFVYFPPVCYIIVSSTGNDGEQGTRQCDWEHAQEQSIGWELLGAQLGAFLSDFFPDWFLFLPILLVHWICKRQHKYKKKSSKVTKQIKARKRKTKEK